MAVLGHHTYEKTLVLMSFFPWIPDFPRIADFLTLRHHQQIHLDLSAEFGCLKVRLPREVDDLK